MEDNEVTKKCKGVTEYWAYYFKGDKPGKYSANLGVSFRTLAEAREVLAKLYPGQKGVIEKRCRIGMTYSQSFLIREYFISPPHTDHVLREKRRAE